jgi:hypothetical protein
MMQEEASRIYRNRFRPCAALTEPHRMPRLNSWAAADEREARVLGSSLLGNPD